MEQYNDVWKFSQNGIYAVNIEYEDMLFIRTDADATIHPFLIEIKDIDEDLMPPPPPRRGGSAYRAYTFYKRFGSRAENDCLLFAEGMSINKFPYMNEECQFREKITHKIFGDSDEQNIDIAGEVYNFRQRYSNVETENLLVNPEIGECYVIMVREYIPDGYIPYHVGYVLFKDGTTNITIEAHAGGKNKKPLFDIYSTSTRRGGSTLPSFHETYRDIFVITPLHIQNAQISHLHTLKNAHEVGDLNVQSCNTPRRIIEPITSILKPISATENS